LLGGAVGVAGHSIDFSVLMVLFRLAPVAEQRRKGGGLDKDRAAGNVKGDSADPRGTIRRQEQNGVGHVVGRPEALDRMAVAQLFLDGFGYLLLIALGQDRLRGYAVDPDAVGSRLGCELLGEHLDTLWRRRKPAGTGGLGDGRRPRT
jgi:hypothetical protein